MLQFFFLKSFYLISNVARIRRAHISLLFILAGSTPNCIESHKSGLYLPFLLISNFTFSYRRIWLSLATPYTYKKKMLSFFL